MVAVPGATAVTVAVEIPFLFFFGVCIYEKNRIFEAFFESTIY